MPTNKRTSDSELVERIARLVRSLGISWSGPGGVYLLDEVNREPRWCVYSELMGTGAKVEIRVNDGEILSIEEANAEQIGELAPPSERLRASDDEVIEFLRQKVTALGWRWPERLSVEWDGRYRWHVREPAAEVADERFEAEVRGVRHKLQLSSIRRRSA